MYKNSRNRGTRKGPQPGPLFAGRPLPELYRDGYGFVPKLVMENPGLSAKAKALYCVYAAVAGTRPEGRCFCSWKTVSTYLNGTAVSTLRDARSELVAKNYIQMSRKGCRAVIKLSPLLLPSNNISGAYVPRNLITGKDLAISEKCIFMLIATIGCEHRGYAAHLTYNQGVEKLVIGRNTFSQHLRSLISRGLVKQLATSTYIACTGLAPEPEKPAFVLPEALKDPFARLCALSVNANHPEDAAERYAQWVEKGVSPEIIEKAYKKYVSVKRNDCGMEDRYFPRLSNWLDPDNGSNGCSEWVLDARQAAYYAKKKAERLAAARAEVEKASHAGQRAAQTVERAARKGDAPRVCNGEDKKESPTSPRLEELRAARSALIASCMASLGRNAAEVAPKLKEVEALIAEEEKHALSSTQALPEQYSGAPYVVPRPCTTRRELLDDSQNGACAPGRGFEVVEKKTDLLAACSETQGVESREESSSDEYASRHFEYTPRHDSGDGEKDTGSDESAGKRDDEKEDEKNSRFADELAGKQADETVDERQEQAKLEELADKLSDEADKRPSMKKAASLGLDGKSAEFQAHRKSGERRRRPALRNGLSATYAAWAAFPGQLATCADPDRQERACVANVVPQPCIAPHGAMNPDAAHPHVVDVAKVNEYAAGAAVGSSDNAERAGKAAGASASGQFGNWVPLSGGWTENLRPGLEIVPPAESTPYAAASQTEIGPSALEARHTGVLARDASLTAATKRAEKDSRAVEPLLVRKTTLCPISPANGRLDLLEHARAAVVYDGRVSMPSSVQNGGTSPPTLGWENDVSFSGQLPLSARQKDAWVQPHKQTRKENAMPDFGDEVAASVDGEFKQTRNALVRAACSKFCQTITKKIKEFKESNAAAAVAAAAEGAQSVELNLKCAETGADPVQAFDKLREIAAGEGFPDIDPANMQLIGTDNPAAASAVVAFPKGALGQVTSLAQSFEQTMGLMAADAPQAVQAATQCHVMGFENIPAELRPTFLAEITQACADQGFDLSAVSASTRDSGLLAGNISITCNSAEEFSRAEAAVSSIAPRWVKAAGGISCAEGIVPADELPLSADELSEQAQALAAQLIDSGFPSPVVTLSRNGIDGARPDPDSFSMGVSYDRAAGARMGLDDAKLSSAVGKWRTGEKAKIAKNGAPAAGSFAEKKMRAIAGADIVTRDPAKMSPKGRNLVAENAERAAAAKAKRLASMAKAAI